MDQPSSGQPLPRRIPGTPTASGTTPGSPPITPTPINIDLTRDAGEGEDLDEKLRTALLHYLARKGEVSDPSNVAYLQLFTLITRRPTGYEVEARRLAQQLEGPDHVERHRVAAAYALALADNLAPTTLYQRLRTQVYPLRSTWP